MSSLRALPTTQPERLTDRVADEVRAQMARARMTQAELAEILGLTQSTVSKRLRGRIAFDTEELEKLAVALGVHPARFFGGVPSDGPGSGPSPSGGHTEP